MGDFIRIHWGALAATDFFTVEVWSLGGLVRYNVLFVIDLATRRVHIAGIAPKLNGEWMKTIARNLTDTFDGFLLGKQYLIHDRDPLFTKSFCHILKTAGVENKRIPAKSPNLNACAERFVLSIKSECINRMIFFSEAPLRRAIQQFALHYNEERNHQGMRNRLLVENIEAANTIGEVHCRQRLGGMLRFYHRDAA